MEFSVNINNLVFILVMYEQDYFWKRKIDVLGWKIYLLQNRLFDFLKMKKKTFFF